MNSQRRADLQRKLSMGAVPRPPAGLAERIKNDIPNYLQAEPERQRFSRSVAFSMRVAASILLLITSVFVTLNMLEPRQTPSAARSAGRSDITPVAMRTAQKTQTATKADTAPSEEIQLEMVDELTPQKKSAPAAPASIPVAQPVMVAGARNEVRQRANEDDRDYSVTTATESIRVTAEAPAVTERSYDAEAFAYAPPMQEDAAAPAPAPPAAKTRSERVSSSFLTKEAIADGLDLSPRKNVFGIDVDPDAFHRIKTSIENGERPAKSIVNVEALVNYFAGSPSRPPRHGVRLEVEASPAPVEKEGDHAVLRFTVDTPSSETHADESIAPVARDARVEIRFNSDAVAGFHRVGDDDPIVAESVLLSNVSVTALYELELRPRLKSSQRIATVSLHYRSVSDGRSHDVEQVIHARDLTLGWARASRRHRLASLGALWGESLQGSSPGVDVARRAEELVTQNPKDPLARELADAANATGGEW